jgi:hypothetical protein
VSRFHCRQYGHCGSSKTVSVAGASARPSVSPRCGMPTKVDEPDSVWGTVAVVVGELESPLAETTMITATTASAAAAAAASR